MTREPRISPPDGGSLRDLQPRLTSAIDRFYESTTRLCQLDPIVTELVRLRCARHHDCRICKAVRLRDARDSGVDEAMTVKVDSFEESDLDERLKVALRYTDAFINGPAEVEAQLAAQLVEHFSPAQIVELSLDIVKWSTQKIHVSFGVDVMQGVDVASGSVTFFEFDETGRPTNFVSSEEETSFAESD